MEIGQYLFNHGSMFLHQRCSRVDLWPSQLYIYMTHEVSTLHDFQAWIKRHSPPVCAFMPDRIEESHTIGINQNNFASLSRTLLLNQMVS